MDESPIYSPSFLYKTSVMWILQPILLILFLPFYLYRLLIKCLHPIFHPDSPGMMALTDVIVAEKLGSGDSANKGTGLASIVLEGRENLEKLRTQFQEKVIDHRNVDGSAPYEKFTWYYESWMGFYFWTREPSPFNIENHIRYISESTKLESVHEENIMEVIGKENVATRGFLPKMSPWELLIIPNIISSDEKSPPKFVLVFKLHHTLIDGFSWLKLMTVHLGGQELRLSGGQQEDNKGKQSYNWSKILKRMPQLILRHGAEHYKVLFGRDENEWHLSSSKLCGLLNCAHSQKFPLKTLSLIAKEYGVSTSTVLYCALGGGIRRYWKNILQKEDDQLPKVMQTLSALPVTIVNHPKDGLVNHWTFYNLPLSIREKDVNFRLKNFHNSYHSLRNSILPDALWTLSPMYSALPNWLLDIVGTNRFSTIHVSNGVGPSTKLTIFDEWPMVDLHGVIPRLRSHAGIGILVYTYAGQCRLSLSIDRTIMPTRKQVVALANCIDEEILAMTHQSQIHSQV